MANNKITSDIISRRLGNQAPSRDGGYEDIREVSSRDQGEDAGGAPILGFLAAIVGTFAAVGLGTFYFMGGGFSLDGIMPAKNDEKVLASSVDGACKSMWVVNGRNDDAISCYLKTHVERLCKREERAFLVTKFKQYAYEMNVFITQQEIANAKVRNEVNQRLITLLNNPKALKEAMSAEDGGANMLYVPGKGVGGGGNTGNPIGDISRDAMMNTPNAVGLGEILIVQREGRKQVVDLVRSLGERGYLTKGDFGWFPDSRIVEAFEDIKVRETPCKI